MEQKISFLRDYLSEKYYFSSLCQAYGISRKTGYKWVKRYDHTGLAGLRPLSRRPHTCSSSTGPALVERILFWRKRKLRNPWGAKKIRVKLLEEFDPALVPSVTTIHGVLDRAGLVNKRKYRRRVEAVHPRFVTDECNDIWSIDHQGHFQLGNGRRCHPLTLSDSYSKVLLLVKGQYHERWRSVRTELRRVFQEWGQPRYLHSDNGSAFASIQSPCGYGSLSYWLIDHGIGPLFSDPGKPTQNASHERKHRDLQAECCRPAAYNLSAQNRVFCAYQREYNGVRPHETLGQRTPLSVHRASPQRYRDRVRSWDYAADQVVRKVCANGALRWKTHAWVSISNALRGRYIGVKRLGERVYQIYYRGVCLGHFDEGDELQRGHFYQLVSDRDLAHRERDAERRRRKK